MLKQYNIKVNISLLVGFVGENDNTIGETIQFITDSKPDFTRINIWSPSFNLNNSNLLKKYNFSYNKETWSHSTMCEEEAINSARKIYLESNNTIFLPPFSSIFDQWPVLASLDLEPDTIKQIFQEYYIISKLRQSNLNSSDGFS